MTIKCFINDFRSNNVGATLKNAVLAYFKDIDTDDIIWSGLIDISDAGVDVAADRRAAAITALIAFAATQSMTITAADVIFPYTVNDPVQADWNQASAAAPDFIKNKPSIPSVPGNATQSTAGLMSAADKAKLDNTPKVQRTRVQTNTSGQVTWNFPTAFAAAPIVIAVPEDNNAGVSVDVKITSISASSVTLQISKISTVLGILQLTANPQSYVHITAIEA